LVRAALVVEYSVVLVRKLPIRIYPIAQFDFACTGLIEAPDRKYTSTLKAKKEWGLMEV